MPTGGAARGLDLLRKAKEKAESVARTGSYTEFLKICRKEFPWWFESNSAALERDHLRVVDHHLEKLMPRITPYATSNIRRVLDFGCGSGGSAVALAMVCPEVHLQGTDVELGAVMIARERAKLYGVERQCTFRHVSEGQSLPFPDESFDLCVCSSVLEYVIDPDVRKFCVQEMARLIGPDGLLFVSVPNRIYPFEIHTRKWGWNYFPKFFEARIVDATVWEIIRLAQPTVLKLHGFPVLQLLTPWSNFCLKRA